MPIDTIDPLDPEDISYFSYDWCSLPWSPWVSFSADKHEFREIPKEPGLYRIRPVGKDFLMYIGETRRPIHDRLDELRHSLQRKDLMPWNDPHTAAPALWAWRDAENFEYECSAAPLDASVNGRRGMESFLLYRYRQERGESPLCNFDRFHPRYRKSTNRKNNLRGGKLEAEQKDNPAGGLSHPPLHAEEKPGDQGWMGIEWSSFEALVQEKIQKAPEGPGLYILSDAGENVYLGQSGNCMKRLLDHSKKSWDEKELQFSFHSIDTAILPHQLRELENDLVGNYFETYRKAPEYQFRNYQ